VGPRPRGRGILLVSPGDGKLAESRARSCAVFANAESPTGPCADWSCKCQPLRNESIHLTSLSLRRLDPVFPSPRSRGALVERGVLVASRWLSPYPVHLTRPTEPPVEIYHARTRAVRDKSPGARKRIQSPTDQVDHLPMMAAYTCTPWSRCPLADLKAARTSRGRRSSPIFGNATTDLTRHAIIL